MRCVAYDFYTSICWFCFELGTLKLKTVYQFLIMGKGSSCLLAEVMAYQLRGYSCAGLAHSPLLCYKSLLLSHFPEPELFPPCAHVRLISSSDLFSSVVVAIYNDDQPSPYSCPFSLYCVPSPAVSQSPLDTAGEGSRGNS